MLATAPAAPAVNTEVAATLLMLALDNAPPPRLISRSAPNGARRNARFRIAMLRATMAYASTGSVRAQIMFAAANASPEVANITRGQPSGNLRSPARRLHNPAAATLHFSTRLVCRSGDER